MTYRCLPENRPQLRDHLEARTLHDFERWKQEGRLADYLVLLSLDMNKDAWDVMIILDFASPLEVDGWREVQRTSPGGLSLEALRLVTPLETDRADLGWQGRAPAKGRSPRAVFFVRPYYYKDKETYRAFFAAYNKPQLDAWLREGGLDSYRVFLNQNASGDPWDVLFVYEYADLASVGRRDAVKELVDAEMKKNPSWALLDEIKGSIRTSGRVTLSEPVVAKRPSSQAEPPERNPTTRERTSDPDAPNARLKKR